MTEVNLRVVDFTMPDPNEEIIETLTDLLSRAKSGELQRFIYAAQTHENTIDAGWRLGGSFTETVGMSAILNHAILNDDILRRIGDLSGETLVTD